MSFRELHIYVLFFSEYSKKANGLVGASVYYLILVISKPFTWLHACSLW